MEKAALNLSKIVTLGVYGFDESGFFDALKEAGVDTFCDIRYRRGVRGSEYVFVNSRRLQARLAEMGVCYLHFRELAPSQALRKGQAAADKQARVAKRQRTELSDEFINGYSRECLNTFSSAEFAARLPPDAKTIALFCVEREPKACHRSLLAERLRKELNVAVVHLSPS